MPIYLDEDPENADWPKRTWDVYTHDGELVTTLAQLRTILPAYYTDADVKKLLQAPAPSMPASLRRELEAL